MDIFRIDCFVEPFTPRLINDQQFEPAFDNPANPKAVTGLFFDGEASDEQLARYAGMEPHFTVTRLGATQEDAQKAREARAAALAAPAAKTKAKAAPAPSA